MNRERLRISDEVLEALNQGRPVVALESTLITHGMPYPVNVETAIHVEACVREKGCVPATIAIIDGQICIGLSGEEIALLGRTERDQVLKASSSDLAYAVSKGIIASTTVAATMICAKLAGISVFATGGIGGVHRGGENSMDVSADIYELARTDVVVVCAGAKAVLDIGRTLEVLESQGVPVVGYQSSKFPAFYYRDSGFSLRMSAESAAEVAKIVRAKRQLGLLGGIVVANPVPEAEALNYNQVEGWIENAMRDAVWQNIGGKEVTPFLLERVAALSEGKSLACNVALIKNNASLAAEIAKNLASPRGFEPLLPP